MNYRSATIAFCSISTIFIMELDFFASCLRLGKQFFCLTVIANDKKNIKRYYQVGYLWLRKCDFFSSIGHLMLLLHYPYRNWNPNCWIFYLSAAGYVNYLPICCLWLKDVGLPYYYKKIRRHDISACNFLYFSNILLIF